MLPVNLLQLAKILLNDVVSLKLLALGNTISPVKFKQLAKPYCLQSTSPHCNNWTTYCVKV